jgi:hypothetical protein
MVKSYGKSDNTVALEFASYRLYSNQPYVSDTHGGRLVMNYANETGKAYGAYENAGTFPSGSKLAKPSFMVKGNGRASLGPLFIMEKMAAGFNADSDDWRYVMIMPNGSIFGTTNGKGSDKVEFCIGCHQSVTPGQGRILYRLPPVGDAGTGQRHAPARGVPRKIGSRELDAGSLGPRAGRRQMIPTLYMGRRYLLRLGASALFFAAIQPQARADFADGLQAYDGGDLESAVEAWRDAAAAGDLDAVVALAGLYAEGTGLPRDWRAAARLYRQAADTGHKIAQLNLGELYAFGRGVERDLEQAYLWYGLAAEQRSAWAARELAALTQRLPADALARAKALLASRRPPQP